jgi:hypothetical protein
MKSTAEIPASLKSWSKKDDTPSEERRLDDMMQLMFFICSIIYIGIMFKWISIYVFVCI